MILVINYDKIKNLIIICGLELQIILIFHSALEVEQSLGGFTSITRSPYDIS